MRRLVLAFVLLTACGTTQTKAATVTTNAPPGGTVVKAADIPADLPYDHHGYFLKTATDNAFDDGTVLAYTIDGEQAWLGKILFGQCGAVEKFRALHGDRVSVCL